jgi:hypothetical protein
MYHGHIGKSIKISKNWAFWTFLYKHHYPQYACPVSTVVTTGFLQFFYFLPPFSAQKSTFPIFVIPEHLPT